MHCACNWACWAAKWGGNVGVCAIFLRLPNWKKLSEESGRANVPNVPRRTLHGNIEKTFNSLIRKGIVWTVPSVPFFC
jgi:hypothetical protein